MKPRYYQICLWLTVAECTVAFSAALAQWVNLVPLWITMPDAQNLTLFGVFMATGYGWWSGVWAIPNYVMLKNNDIASRRLFAKLAGIMYFVWWIFWWDQIVTGAWQWYVYAFYIPARFFQMSSHLTYGFFGPKP
ncbi:MAG: hypothetical protein GWP58_03440 [Gammaproteobacteria bacterium]|jgi:hypothetical protein|nr:hypothetical protein [Gammaproteobacteria bacterium]